MTSLPIIRASLMPTASICPAAGSSPREVMIDQHDPSADAGTNFHRTMALVMQDEAVPETDAETEEMVATALQWLSSKGFIWKPGERFASIINIEWRLEHAPIAGTIDYFFMEHEAAELASIVDWKSGWKEGRWPMERRNARKYSGCGTSTAPCSHSDGPGRAGLCLRSARLLLRGNELQTICKYCVAFIHDVA